MATIKDLMKYKSYKLFHIEMNGDVFEIEVQSKTSTDANLLEVVILSALSSYDTRGEVEIKNHNIYKEMLNKNE